PRTTNSEFKRRDIVGCPSGTAKALLDSNPCGIRDGSARSSQAVNRRRQTPTATRFEIARLEALLAAGLCFPSIQAHAQSPRSTLDTNALPPFQIISTNSPPLPPSQFSPDAGVSPASTNVVRPAPVPHLTRTTNSLPPP